MSRQIPIHTDYIKLDSLLKLAGEAATGGASKETILAGGVTVNGEVCRMRGKKLRAGDVVLFAGEALEVVSACG
ncbi:MAG: RNA-binding S4 domain-containing protein [Oscillospiraceae bacterium]